MPCHVDIIVHIHTYMPHDATPYMSVSHPYSLDSSSLYKAFLPFSCSSKHKNTITWERLVLILFSISKHHSTLFTVQYFTNHIHFSYRWFYFSLFFSLCGRKKKRRRMKQIRSLNQEQSKTTNQYLSFWNSTCIARDVSRRSTAPFAISKVLDHYSYLDYTITSFFS